MAVIIIPNTQPVAEAAARRTAQCHSFMQGYINDGATSEQMRYYADCVAWLHPLPDDTRTLWFKAAIICAFVGFAVGMWMMKASRESWLASIVFGGTFGAAFGGCVPAVIAGAWYGAKYLVS